MVLIELFKSAIAKIWVVTTITMVLCGCTKEIRYDFENKDFPLEVHNNGEIDSLRTYESDSKLAESFVQWFHRNSGGWKSSYITYAPNIQIYTKKHDLNINFIKLNNVWHAVINYKQGDSHDQKIKTLNVKPSFLIENNLLHKK